MAIRMVDKVFQFILCNPVDFHLVYLPLKLFCSYKNKVVFKRLFMISCVGTRAPCFALNKYRKKKTGTETLSHKSFYKLSLHRWLSGA